MTTDTVAARIGARPWLGAAVPPLLAAVLLAVGCGRSLPAVAPVSGTVTRAGKPVTQGMVMFQPEKGRMGVGKLGSDGRFTITTFTAGDGAIIGRHKVAIEAYTQGSGPRPPTAAPAADDTEAFHASGPVVWLVPENYASSQTTPLTADVKPGSNTIDFAVP
jgi:hypothetical protein